MWCGEMVWCDVVCQVECGDEMVWSGVFKCGVVMEWCGVEWSVQMG